MARMRITNVHEVAAPGPDGSPGGGRSGTRSDLPQASVAAPR